MIRRGLALCLLPAVLPAQATGTIDVGAYLQAARIDGARGGFTTDRPVGVGLRAHLWLNTTLGAELEASTSNVRGGPQREPRSFNQLVARGTWRRPLRARTDLIVGAGIARSDYEVTYNFGVNAMAGARVRVGRHLAWRNDLSLSYLPRSRNAEIAVRSALSGVAGPFVGESARDRATGNRTVQEPGTIEVGTFVQQLQLDPVWNLRNGGVFGVRVGAYLTSRGQVDVESTYGRRRVAYDGQPGANGAILRGDQRFRHTTFTVRGIYQLPIASRSAILVGVGPIRSSPQYVDFWGASGIVGTRVALAPGVLARGELVANYLPGARAIDVGLRLGVGVARWFGERTPVRTP
jgi:hypothetical protein